MNKIRIYIHYNITDHPWGGGNSFLKAFRKYINEKRYDEFRIVNNLWGSYDIFFMNGGHKDQGKYLNIKELKTLQYKHRLFHKKQPKFVYRLDGARFRYNKIQSPMDNLQFQALKLADFIIFQSNDSLDAFRELGYNGDNYTIIPNGVDQNLFNMEGKTFWVSTKKLRVLSANWSSNVHKGYPVIAKFAQNPDIKVSFVGNWNEDVPANYINILPPVSQKELAKYYKEADVFLHPSENESCPNVVIEALSCGLPVIYHPSGGTQKIAEKYGIALPADINANTIAETIQNMKKNYHKFIERIQQDFSRFSIENIGKRYLEEFKRLYENERS